MLSAKPWLRQSSFCRNPLASNSSTSRLVSALASLLSPQALLGLQSFQQSGKKAAQRLGVDGVTLACIRLSKDTVTGGKSGVRVPLVGSPGSSAESALQDFDQRRFAGTVLPRSARTSATCRLKTVFSAGVP